MPDLKIPASKRLSYRLVDVSLAGDQAFLFELDQDPQVMRYITNGQPTSLQHFQQWFLPRIQSFTNATEGWGLWMLSCLETEAVMGWILVRPVDFFSEDPKQQPTQWDNLEIGWRLSRSYWGQGYSTEAASQILKQLIKRRSIKKLTATALVENSASINIMKKLGLTLLRHYNHKDEHGEFPAVVYEKTIDYLVPLNSL